MGGGASAGEANKVVKPNKKPSKKGNLLNSDKIYTFKLPEEPDFVKIQVCQFEAEFDTAHNSPEVLKSPDFIMEMQLKWEKSGSYYLMELMEMEARDLMTDQVLDGTVLKSYKFTVNQYGEYMDTRNLEEIIDVNERGDGRSIGELKPDQLKLMKMEMERFLKTFWKGFAELWLGIEIGNENPEESKGQENTRHVTVEEMRGQPMFGFTYTHSIPKRDIDAFAKKRLKDKKYLKGVREKYTFKGLGSLPKGLIKQGFPVIIDADRRVEFETLSARDGLLPVSFKILHSNVIVAGLDANTVFVQTRLVGLHFLMFWNHLPHPKPLAEFDAFKNYSEENTGSFFEDVKNAATSLFQ